MTESFPVNAGNVPVPTSHSFVTTGPSGSAFHTAIPGLGGGGPGVRRKSKDATQIIPNLSLERIIGVSTSSPNVLASAASHDLIAYAAGAVVVLYNHRRNKQVGFLYASQGPSMTTAAATTPMTTTTAAVHGLNTVGSMDSLLAGGVPTSREGDEKKPTPSSTRAKQITCVAFSPNGNYLAAGEIGHQPRILIWSVKDQVLLHECRAHNFGVLSLSFSTRNRFLVSVGFQHDGYVYVWNWRKGIQIAGNKVTSKLNSLDISSGGLFFVTAGLRHVKYWYFDATGRLSGGKNSASRETQPLEGRAGVLGDLRNSNFVGVSCDKTQADIVYFITNNGILCMFNEKRGIDKWVDLQVKQAYSLVVSSKYILCSCSDGIVRIFEPQTLQYCGCLPKPHLLGIDITAIKSVESQAAMLDGQDIVYPDAISLCYDEETCKVTVVYADHSLYMWDIHDLKKIGKYRSFLAHSDCVWGVQPYPNTEPNKDCTAETLPSGTFVTYSADGSVRMWNIDQPHSSTSSSTLSPPLNYSVSPKSPSPTLSEMTNTLFLRRNIYSRELLRMIHVDPNAMECLKSLHSHETLENGSPDISIRSLKISADGKLLATGDRYGNLRVHQTATGKQVAYLEAHDSEILDIEFSNPCNEDSPFLIATASRDRLLHVFDVRQDFQLVQSLDDHSSSITAVRFTKDSQKLVSCGADKGVIFRHRSSDNFEHDTTTYNTYHNYSGRSSVFDMAIDINSRYIAIVTGERRLYVLSIESGKPIRTCKPETAEEILCGSSADNSGGSLINVDLDPYSGTFAVTSGSDKCVRLFDLTNSTCIERACAHSEFITSLAFLKSPANQLRVVSTSSDGTVFIWKVHPDIVAKMKARAAERSVRIKQVGSLDTLGVQTHQSNATAAVEPANSISRQRRVSTTATITQTSKPLARVRHERRTISSVSSFDQKDGIPARTLASRRERPGTSRNQLELHHATKNDQSKHRGSSKGNQAYPYSPTVGHQYGYKNSDHGHASNGPPSPSRVIYRCASRDAQRSPKLYTKAEQAVPDPRQSIHRHDQQSGGTHVSSTLHNMHGRDSPTSRRLPECDIAKTSTEPTNNTENDTNTPDPSALNDAVNENAHSKSDIVVDEETCHSDDEIIFIPTPLERDGNVSFKVSTQQGTEHGTTDSADPSESSSASGDEWSDYSINDKDHDHKKNMVFNDTKEVSLNDTDEAIIQAIMSREIPTAASQRNSTLATTLPICENKTPIHSSQSLTTFARKDSNDSLQASSPGACEDKRDFTRKRKSMTARYLDSRPQASLADFQKLIADSSIEMGREEALAKLSLNVALPTANTSSEKKDDTVAWNRLLVDLNHISSAMNRTLELYTLLKSRPLTNASSTVAAEAELQIQTLKNTLGRVQLQGSDTSIPTQTLPTDQDTLRLLDDYSARLLKMVQVKMGDCPAPLQ